MPAFVSELLIAVACACAGVGGASLGVVLVRSYGEAHARKLLRGTLGSAGESGTVVSEAGGAVSAVLGLIERASRVPCSGRLLAVLRSPPFALGLNEAPTLLARAGIQGSASLLGVLTVRAELALVGSLIGALAGSVFSTELMAVLACVGGVLGYASVVWALRAEAAARNANMERSLSQMIEVVVLGLQSGLSFERAFSLYPRYFDTGLAHAMEQAAEQWGMGLATREEALRKLEASYDSVLLSRVIGSMVRSLRFGTSIVESLESSAVEARETHRARMEERVAKVAVKMMLPVGALILPAMLLLVLGPVLLELMEGF